MDSIANYLFNLPCIHPGNSSCTFAFKSLGDIQLPRDPLTPSAAGGMDSNFWGVDITVLDSTLATSFGSVRAKKQLSYLKQYVIHVRNNLASMLKLEGDSGYCFTRKQLNTTTIYLLRQFDEASILDQFFFQCFVFG